MKTKRRQPGLSLIEMAVIIAIIALLATIAVPAMRAFIKSFETGSNTKSVINAALSHARAIAIKEQRYAGIRFQKAYQSEDILEAPQYMTFIIQDPNIMAYGFRAIKGLKPIKLPDSVGVTDLIIVNNRNVSDPVSSGQVSLENPLISPAQKDTWLGDAAAFTDMSTFSIVFSPTGKLVIHGVRVRNKDGYPDTNKNTLVSNDDVFNKKAQVDVEDAMFYQDDYFGDSSSPYPNLGLGPEPSRNSFVIYETREFKKAFLDGQAWSEYLSGIKPVYINAYTGTIISQD